MSILAVRDEQGNGIPRINIRIAMGDKSSDEAIFDVFTDLAGNTGWPIPFWPTGKYTLWLNDHNVDSRFDAVSLVITDQGDHTIVLPQAPSSRPATVQQSPLPPFDQGDSENQVHTALPSEQVIPDHFADPTWMRADFNGVKLNLTRWNKEPLPFLKGANSTPLEMLMTPMLQLYPRYWQDADLTEHAERGYDDFVIAVDPWNAKENGFDYSSDSVRDWAKYIKSWGFRVVLWQGDRPPDSPSETLQKCLDAGVVDFYIHGKEVDSFMTSEQFEASLQTIDRYINGKIPIGVHFTANAERHMGYPIGFPRDTFLNDWSLYNGRVHLCQQLDVDASAGLQGASMYYARQHVNAGIGDAAKGPGAPDSRVIAFETMATAQLYGKCTEEYGCLRDWELLCGTRNNPKVRPVSGFGNGGRYPDGSVL